MKSSIRLSPTASLALFVALALSQLGSHQVKAEGLGLGNLLGEFGSTISSLTTSVLGGTGGITSLVSGASSPMFGLFGSVADNLSGNQAAATTAVVSGPGAALGPTGAAYGGAYQNGVNNQAIASANMQAGANANAAAAAGAMMTQQQAPVMVDGAGLRRGLVKRDVGAAIGSGLGGIGSGLGGIGSSVGGVASGAINAVGSTLNGLGTALTGVGGTINGASSYPYNNGAYNGGYNGYGYGSPVAQQAAVAGAGNLGRKKRDVFSGGALGSGLRGIGPSVGGVASGAFNAVGSTLNGLGSALSGATGAGVGGILQAAGAGALANARDQRIATAAQLGASSQAAESLATGGLGGGFGVGFNGGFSGGFNSAAGTNNGFNTAAFNGAPNAGSLIGGAMGALGGAVGAAGALGAGVANTANAGVAAVTGVASGALSSLSGGLSAAAGGVLNPASAAAAAGALSGAHAAGAPFGSPSQPIGPFGHLGQLPAPLAGPNFGPGAPVGLEVPAIAAAALPMAPSLIVNPQQQQQALINRNALATSALGNAQAEAAIAGADMAAHGANNAHSASLASNAYRQAKLVGARDRVNIAGTIQNSARISDAAIATHDAATKAEDSLLGSELAVDSAATVLDSDAAYIPPVTSSLLRSLPYGRLGVRNILPKPLTYPSVLLPDVWLNGAPVNYLNVPLRMLPYGVAPTSITNQLWQSGAHLANGQLINSQPFVANNGRFLNAAGLVFDPASAYLANANAAGQLVAGSSVAPILANGQIEAQDELGVVNQVNMQQLAGPGMAATYNGYGRTNPVPMLTGSVSDINLMPTTTIGTTYPIGSALVIEPRDSYFQNYVDSASSRQNFDEKQQ